MKFDFLSGARIKMMGPTRVISAREMLDTAFENSSGYLGSRAITNDGVYNFYQILPPGTKIIRPDGVWALSPWCIIKLNPEPSRPEQHAFSDLHIILHLRDISNDILDHISVVSMFGDDQTLYPVTSAKQDGGLVITLHPDPISLEIDQKLVSLGSNSPWWTSKEPND